jgi:hypothetical protein
VAWNTTDGKDGDGYGVAAQRFSASGSPQGAELQVNTFVAGTQGDPQVAVDGDGDFVIAWSSQDQDGNLSGVFARRFNAAAGAQPFESRVNTYVTSNQASPAIAMDLGGDFVITWQGANLQDGSGDGIFAQRYGGTNIDADGDGVFGALTDGLLILRYGFGLRGAALITGAVSASCSRCTAPEIETFLDSVI